jgi:hypothetical protein
MKKHTSKNHTTRKGSAKETFAFLHWNRFGRHCVPTSMAGYAPRTHASA